jgi:hypothetical protein
MSGPRQTLNSEAASDRAYQRSDRLVHERVSRYDENSGSNQNARKQPLNRV